MSTGDDGKIDRERAVKRDQDIARALKIVGRRIRGIMHGSIEIHINDGRVVRLVHTESEQLT